MLEKLTTYAKTAITRLMVLLVALMTLPKLRHDKRGITGLVLATVVALIVITIVVPIGIIITYNLSTVVSGLGLPANSAAANASNQVFTTAWQAYNLAAIMSIVAAAGAIITIIIVAFARFSGRGV